MRIAVLGGGHTPEHEVSLHSARRILGAVQELGHDAWLVDPSEAPLAESLAEHRPDLAWLALHGNEGEDGTVQRLLDLLGIVFTGTGGFECACAFDKMLAKEVFVRAEVPTPPWVTIEATALRDLGAGAALGTAVERVGLPCVVKPSRGGSAFGVGFVEREADVARAVMAALSFSGAAIVERRVRGTEVAVGMVGAPLEPLPLVEIVPKSGVYDYASRYTAGATDHFAPARVRDEVAVEARAVASRAAAALSLRDLTRVDMIIDHDGVPWVLEVNVSPGMTDTSLVPMAAQAAGMDLAELCDHVIRAVGARRPLPT